MKLYKHLLVSTFFISTIFISLSANAGLVTGPAGRAKFEEFRKSHLDMFVDFEDLDNGPHWDLHDMEFKTTIVRWPLPVAVAPPGTPVILLPYDYVQSSPDNNRLMGAVKGRNGYIPDGQSKYEIVFDKCLERVGLLRMWNTYSVTRFYQHQILLKEYRNKDNQEFVGYIVDPNKPGDDCVTRVEFDGHYTEEPYGDDLRKVYQVGSVDDLFFSKPSIEIDTDPDQLEVVAGGSTKLTMTLRNLAAYEIKNVTIDTNLYIEGVTSIGYTVTIDVPPKAAVSKIWEIDVPILAPAGYYRIVMRIFSSTHMLIYDKTIWCHVIPEDKKMTLIAPLILKLLLNPKNPE